MLWRMDKGFLRKLSACMYFDDTWKSIVVLANPKTVLNDRKALKDVRRQMIRADQLAVMRKLYFSEGFERYEVSFQRCIYGVERA